MADVAGLRCAQPAEEQGVRSGEGKTAPLPVIAVTSGEPAGIGPDICLARAAQRPCCRAVILADRGLLAARAAQLGLALRLRAFDPAQAPPAGEPVRAQLPHPAPAP